MYVIGLFPTLLPEELRAATPASQYPGQVPSLDGGDQERAYNALMEYLGDMRVGVMRELKSLEEQSSSHSAEHSDAEESSTPTAGAGGAGGKAGSASGSGSSTKANAPKPSQELLAMKIKAQIVDTTLLKCFLQVCTICIDLKFILVLDFNFDIHYSISPLIPYSE